MQINIVIPARRMEHLALERLDSLQLWEARYDQHADGRYEGRRVRHVLLAGAHIAYLKAPQICRRIPFGLVDRRMETTMFAYAALFRYSSHVLQNLWLRAMRVLPIRLRV